VSYADLMEAAIANEFGERSVPVTYNGSQVTGIFRFVGIDTENSRGTGEVARADQATLILLKSDVSDPGYGDTAVVDGRTWRVMKRIKGGGPLTNKVLVERNRGRVA
jgi:hypothetical protein